MIKILLSFLIFTASTKTAPLDKPESNVCSKRNYDRGVGKIKKRCGEGRSRMAGLCYTDCKPGYKSFVTMCQMQCKGEFPVDCGVAYCAKTKGDCAKMVAGVASSVLTPVAATINPIAGATLAVSQVGAAAAGLKTGPSAIAQVHSC